MKYFWLTRSNLSFSFKLSLLLLLFYISLNFVFLSSLVESSFPSSFDPFDYPVYYVSPFLSLESPAYDFFIFRTLPPSPGALSFLDAVCFFSFSVRLSFWVFIRVLSTSGTLHRFSSEPTIMLFLLLCLFGALSFWMLLWPAGWFPSRRNSFHREFDPTCAFPCIF